MEGSNYDGRVLRLLRFFIRLTLVCFAIGTVIGIGAPETGPFEKATLAVLFVAIVLISIPVGRIGSSAS